MTGDKRNGDPRLRTPMHWTQTRAAGFTTGLPWEPLQPDSFTANVSVYEDDPGSLLNLHRQLIHLRAQIPALGAGDFLPLAAPAGIAAYLRRDGESNVLVVANLTDAPIASPALSAGARALRAGSYRASRRFGSGADAATLRVQRDGSIRGFVPFRTIGPLETRIYTLNGAN